MHFSEFETDAYRRARINALQGKYAWKDAGIEAMTAAQKSVWQGDFRREFALALGGLDGWERPPLEPAVVETRQLDGYRRETVTFTTRPGLRAFGYFLIPDDCPAGRPAMLCLPGHGRGVESIIGLAPDGSQRPLRQSEEYAQDFALQCVAQGYPTLALEVIGFGVRRDSQARAEGPDASSCQWDSVTALMLGETVAGWRTWDALRALDYLQTRTDCVDPARLGVMGISGGGLVALFAAALDPRVSACVVSGYFNTFAASILSISHCIDNYVPGLLRLGEMPDLAALIAPRALFVENGRADPIFPIAAFEQAVAQARDIYQTFGVPERFAAETFDGGHQFHGKDAFAFLEERLG
ncbi:MAG: alpha/beta hydrolase family protein [Armatimonadota bacterium]|nr:alpha/beta hydrolase family protein [Armatimonadota bacterium]